MQRSNFIATFNCFPPSQIHPYHSIHTCIPDLPVKSVLTFFVIDFSLPYNSFVSLPALGYSICEPSTLRFLLFFFISSSFYSFRTRTHFQSKNLIIYKFADIITFFSFRLTVVVHWCPHQHWEDWK